MYREIQDPIRNIPLNAISFGKGRDQLMIETHHTIARVVHSKIKPVAGRTIMVIREDESMSSRIIGIGPLPTEQGKDFLFAELASDD